MGKFDDLYQPVAGAVAGGKAKPTLGTVNQALQTTGAKLANDPRIISSGKFNDLYTQAQTIASGGKPPASGFGPTLSKGFFDVLGGIGYALGAPARVIASGTKEIMDLAEGKGFSAKDFVNQAADETFYMSKIVPKSGNKWLDGIIGFGADVLSDPLTYITFGAGAFAGKAGRAALVTKAGEAANIAKAPSLAAKIADGSIMRYGEWALDDAERAVLNVPKGLSWQFGSRSTIGTAGELSGKVSAKAAEIVGKPFASARARIGDLPMLEGLQKITAPKSIKAAGLTAYGRRNLAGKATVELPFSDVIGKVAAYSASSHGMSKGKLFVSQLASEQQDVIRDVVAYETRTGNKLVDVIENVRPPVNAEEARLAKKLAAFQNKVRDTANKITSDFGKRRGVNAYGIGYLDNYVNHTLSPEARELLASENWKRTSPYRSGIEDMLDMSSDEFVRGPAPMRARSLKTSTPTEPSTFLGRPLLTDNGSGFATMKEINDISMEVLGVKWFADDAATYTNAYLNSIGNQVRRVGFVDRLYDYGPDVVKAIQYKMIPDKKLIASWRKVVGSLDTVVRDVTNELAGLTAEAGKTVRAQRNVARKIVERADRKLVNDPAKILKMTKALEKAKAALDAADAVAATKSAEIRSSYATLSAPVRAKLDAIQSALSRNAQDELAAVTVLESEHVRMFPKRKNRPTDAQTLAEEILAGSTSRTESKLKALQTRKKRLERKIGPRGGVTKSIDKSSAEYLAAKTELDSINEEIAKYEGLMKTQSEDFPDGYFVIDEEEMNQALMNGTSASAQFDLDPASNASLFVAPDMNDWHILHPTSSVEDAIFVVNNLGEAFYRQLGDFNITASFEGDRFRQLYADVVNGRSSVSMWGFENPEMDAILSEVSQVRQKLNELRLAERRGEDISAELEAVMTDYLETYTDRVSTFIAKAENEGLDLSGFYGSPDYVASNTVAKVADHALESGTQPYGVGSKQVAGIYLPSSVADPELRKAVGGVVDSEYLDLSNGFLREAVDTTSGRGLELTDPSDPLFQTILDINTQGNRTTESLLALSEQSQLQRSLVSTAEQELTKSTGEAIQIAEDITKIGRQAGGVRSGQTRLEAKIKQQVDAVRRAAEEASVPVPSGKPRGRVKVTRAEAEAQAKKLEKKIADDTKAMEREIRNDPTMSERNKAADAYDTAQRQLDVAEAVKGTNEEWEATFGIAYRTDLQELDELVAQMPPSGATADMHRAWREKTQRTLESLQQANLSPQQKTAIDRIFTQMAGLETQVALLDGYRAGAVARLDNALTGVDGGKLVRDIEKGWADLEGLGVRMPEEVRDMLFNRVRGLNNPEEWGKFKRAYMAYHRFFKITAMLTPGFIVRNAYTAAMNNLVAGVTLAETRAGIKFAYKASREGLDAALKSVPKKDRQLFETAYRAVLATGGGQTVDDLLYPVIKGRGASYLEKRPVRNWIQANEATESAVRMGTALHALNTGADLDGAAALITRYHFNYSDMSTLDEFAKQFVPFWTFATRNIPLQIVNQVARPSVYRAYESLQRNFPVEEGTVLPPWLAARGPLGLTSGVVINPDLPQIDLQDQVRMLADPQRLVSQLNPLIKLPVELMGNRMLATDTPFADKNQEYRGVLDLPAALVASLLGQTGRTAEGDLTLSSKAAYALPNLFPTLATAQRLLPQLGGKEAYLDRQISSIGSSGFGLPFRGISATEQQNELTRRQFALRDLLAQLSMQGYNTQG